MHDRINGVEMYVLGELRGWNETVLCLAESGKELFESKYGRMWDWPDVHNFGMTESGIPDIFIAHRAWHNNGWKIGGCHALPAPRGGERWICDLIRRERVWICLPREFVSQGD